MVTDKRPERLTISRRGRMGLIGLLVLVGAMLAVNVAVVAYLFYVLVAYSPLPDPFRWAVVAGPVPMVIWAILSVFGVNLRMSVWRGTAATSPATIAGGGVPRLMSPRLAIALSGFSLALVLISLIPLVWREGPDNFWWIFAPLCVIAVLAYFWQRHDKR
jgi:hypothetical protein